MSVTSSSNIDLTNLTSFGVSDCIVMKVNLTVKTDIECLAGLNLLVSRECDVETTWSKFFQLNTDVAVDPVRFVVKVAEMDPVPLDQKVRHLIAKIQSAEEVYHVKVVNVGEPTNLHQSRVPEVASKIQNAAGGQRSPSISHVSTARGSQASFEIHRPMLESLGPLRGVVGAPATNLDDEGDNISRQTASAAPSEASEYDLLAQDALGEDLKAQILQKMGEIPNEVLLEMREQLETMDWREWILFFNYCPTTARLLAAFVLMKS